MGDDDHGHTVVRKLAHDAQYVADQFGIECRGRLVEQDRLRLHRQCAGNRHALLLTAGQLRRMDIGLFGQPNPPQQRAAALQRLARGSFFT